MANWYGVGTSFLDFRTRRARRVAAIAAGGVSYYAGYHTGQQSKHKKFKHKFGKFGESAKHAASIALGFDTSVIVDPIADWYYKPKYNTGTARKQPPMLGGHRRRRAWVKAKPRTYGTRRWKSRTPWAGAHRARSNRRTGGYLRIEHKFMDTETSGDSFAVTWATMEDATMKCINAVAQGSTEKTRSGRTYHIHSLFVRGNVHMPAFEAQPQPIDAVTCRVAIVWDRQSNGAQLDPLTVFAAAGSTDILSFRNLQYTQRYVVLFDKIITCVPNTYNEGSVNSFASSARRHQFKYFKKFNIPIKVICKSTGATIADITDNSFHVVGVSTSTTAKLGFQARIRFTD